MDELAPDRQKNFFRTRQNSNLPPDVPLPFYAHNTGISVLREGQEQRSGGILNPFVRISWILSGHGEILVADRAVTAGAGFVSYALYGEERVIRCVSEECRIRFLCFDGPLAEAVLLSFRYPRSFVCGEYPERLFEELDRIMCDDSPARIRRKSSLVWEVIASLAPEEETPNSAEIVPQCILLIRRNLADANFGLETLCDHFHISPATLSRLFRKHAQLSPGRYILNMKLARAVSLLTGTVLPIEEVARQCGFRDRPSFTRFIRRSHGCSPTEYRERHVQRS